MQSVFPLLTLFIVLNLLCGAAFAQKPITLQVDATEAPRNILHAKLHFPARPGPLTLVYPKWIPGEHGPTGPINDLTGLKMSAGSHALTWERDPEDMFAFHLDVPKGADAVDVTLDFLMPPNSGSFSSGASATPQLLDLNWNQVVLYPRGSSPSKLRYAATLLLPKGWKAGTALSLDHHTGDTLRFAPVSLEALVDSPVIAGAFYCKLDLSPKGGPERELDIVADSAAALEISAADSNHFARVGTEAEALFGGHHYRSYHFLLTLSDHVAHFGLEHHECSDNREGEKYLTDPDELMRGAYLLCHEMVHSWNGKYRRPLGLATSDFQEPMKGELLWVYEGLTDYLGLVLAARSGLWTEQNFREYLAMDAAMLDHEPGRNWRSLADTTVSAQLLYESRQEGSAWRRGTDFYGEGDLIWLDADVLIRRQTQGHRSLNDFCRKFYGGESGEPKVVPYSREDIIAALNEVAPYDWTAFFQKRVYDANPRAPLGGIEGGGWRLTYTNGVPAFLKARESARKYSDLRLSLGLIVKEDGTLMDVIPGTPADKASLGAGMKLVAVDGRRWTPEILRAAVKYAAAHTGPVELLVENEDFFNTCKLNYHGGEKYAQLERVASKPDLLGDILQPLNKETGLHKKEPGN